MSSKQEIIPRDRKKKVINTASEESRNRKYFTPHGTQLPDEWKLERHDFSGDY